MTIMAEAADRATAQRAAETVRKQVLIEDRLPPSAGLNDELKTNGADVFYIQGQASDEGSGLSRLGYRFRITGNGRISTTVEGESEAFLPGNGSDLFVIPVVSSVLRSGEIEVESLWIQDAANPANRTDVLGTKLLPWRLSGYGASEGRNHLGCLASTRRERSLVIGRWASCQCRNRGHCPSGRFEFWD